MRGKECKDLGDNYNFGITPAYAGKSHHQSRIQRPTEDHPCVCGEKLQLTLMKLQMQGSPLRMRGKGIFLFVHLMSFRITPAYAGKSATAAIGAERAKDHPCVCGEKTKKHGKSVLFSGSPLRMRGKD